MRYEMKHLGIVGLCFAAMLVTGVALPMNAAGALWLLCVKGGVSLTKYEDNQCTKAKAGGEWGSEALGNSSATVKLQDFTVELTDTNTAAGVSTVRCGHPTVGWGLVSTSNLLLVKEAKVANPKTECERVAGACKAGEIEKVGAVDLPWKIEASEPEGKVAADGNGEPGLEVECNTLLGKEKDTCTSESGKEELIELENTLSGGLSSVLGKFLSDGIMKCSQGGAESGETRGQVGISLSSGSGLGFKGESRQFSIRVSMTPLKGKGATGEFTVTNITGLAGATVKAIHSLVTNGLLFKDEPGEIATCVKAYGINQSCKWSIEYTEARREEGYKTFVVEDANKDLADKTVKGEP